MSILVVGEDCVCVLTRAASSMLLRKNASALYALHTFWWSAARMLMLVLDGLSASLPERTTARMAPRDLATTTAVVL